MRTKQYTVLFYNDSIDIAEFIFYSKKLNLIAEDKLNELIATAKQRPVYWTEGELAKQGIAFCFYMYDRNHADISLPPNNQLLVYIFHLQKNVLPEIFNEIRYMYTGAAFHFDCSKDQKRIIMRFPLQTVSEAIVFKSWDDYISLLIEKNYIAMGIEDRFFADREEMKEFIKILFNYDATIPELYDIKQGSYTYGFASGNTYHIFDVIEKRINNANYRIACVSKVSNLIHPEFLLRVYKENSPDYNYIDKERRFCQYDKETYFYDLSTNEYNEKGNPKFFLEITNKILRDKLSIFGHGERVINNIIYRFYRERVLNDSFGASEYKHDSVLEKYKELIRTGKEVKLNGLIITKNKVEVEGERFKLEFEQEFFNVEEYFYVIRQAATDTNIRYNFNNLYEKILTFSGTSVVLHARGAMFGDIRFKVNGMEIVVNKEEARMRINGIFCRLEDGMHILNKAICYNSVEEYNNYIEEVSHIGIAWKRIISNGVLIKLHNPLVRIISKLSQIQKDKIPKGLNEDLLLRFSFAWDAVYRTQIHLILNNVKYRIKYKGQMKKEFDVPQKHMYMSDLRELLVETVEGFEDQNLFSEIIDNAIEEAKIIQQRGDELVANTIKDTDAVLQKVNIQGRPINGYLINGRRTGSKYFIAEVDLTVYKLRDGNWDRRCVVDNENKQRIFQDKLANRLINIYNEPDFISTIHG
jgi:hypothetical protein